MSPKSNETLEEILNIHQDFCHEQCRKNSEQHAELYTMFHRIDKEVACMAIRVGAIVGAVTGAVSAIVMQVIQMFVGRI